jgi:hypothetical protein
MTHNFDAYKQRRTAILITGENTEDLIEKLRDEEWDIVSLDDFNENLSLWYPQDPNGEEIVNLLFSDAVPGIKQHLANKQDMNVGLCHLNNEIHQPILFEYQQRGYDVVSVDCKTLFGKLRQTVEYIPCPIQKVYMKRKL